MQLRTLRAVEREDLLDLLDLWPMADGWRGRDFFRRTIEDDPTYADSNVWVAVEEPGSRPMSCVQIFPRTIRLFGQPVSCGGIGSVFTHPEHRRSGLASQLLAKAVDDMTARGMEVSLLFAARIAWYTELGWRSLTTRRFVVSSGGAKPQTTSGLDVRRMDPARDLAAIREIHLELSRDTDGCVLRSDEAWSASLQLAGNPEEEFQVGLRDGAVVAYARRCTLDGRRWVTELGCKEDCLEDVVEIVRGLVESAHPSEARRANSQELVLPACDARIEAGLSKLNYNVLEERDTGTMLRFLSPKPLTARLGLSTQSDEDPDTPLFRLLEGRRFQFWPADRF